MAERRQKSAGSEAHLRVCPLTKPIIHGSTLITHTVISIGRWRSLRTVRQPKRCVALASLPVSPILLLFKPRTGIASRVEIIGGLLCVCLSQSVTLFDTCARLWQIQHLFASSLQVSRDDTCIQTQALFKRLNIPRAATKKKTPMTKMYISAGHAMSQRGAPIFLSVSLIYRSY